jgi:hypothetical protein
MERLSQDAEAFCRLMAELGAEDASEGIKIVGVCGTLWENGKCYKEKRRKSAFFEDNRRKMPIFARKSVRERAVPQQFK